MRWIEVNQWKRYEEKRKIKETHNHITNDVIEKKIKKK